MRLLIALALVAPLAAQAQTRPVTFEVAVPGVLAPLDTVYLAGTFNGWNPGDAPGGGADMGPALPMTPAGPGRFRLTLGVSAGPHEYKYTLGSWGSVEMTAADGERDNRTLGAAALVRDTVAQWLVPSVALGAWRADDLLPWQGASFEAWHARHSETFTDTLSAAAVDALVADAEAAWAGDAARLGVPPLPLLPAIVATFGVGPGEGRMEHVVRTHVLPRQRALLDAFEHEPATPSRLGALSSMVYTGVTLPLGFETTAADAAEDVAFSERVVALAERYCAVDFGVRGGTLGCGIRDAAARSAALWALVAASTRGDASTATDGFAALLRAGLEAQPDPGLVRDLAMRHALRSGGGDGLRTLDALLTGTSDRFTNADSLRAAYVRLAPTGGAARFARLLPERPAFRLAVMDDAPRLDGLVMPDVVARGPFAFDRLAGRLVLVDVWATWCGPCLAEIPTFNALHEALRERDDVAFVSVLADARTGGMAPLGAEAFVAAHGVEYPALYDLGDADALGEALDVTAYPSKFLVYPDGTVRRVPLDVDWRVALRLATGELGFTPVVTD